MAENLATVSDVANLTPAQIRAEMRSARARVSVNIDAVETRVWQQMHAVVDDTDGRHGKGSGLAIVLSALSLAERLGMFRYLKAKVSARLHRAP